MHVYGCDPYNLPKANPRLPQDIAYIYEILHCSHFICSDIAENDEVVAVEDFIDVGNILGKIWVSLYPIRIVISC